jgi:hypothetical protein
MVDCTVIAPDSVGVKIKVKAKVNIEKFLYVPGKTLRFPGDRDSQIS